MNKFDRKLNKFTNDYIKNPLEELLEDEYQLEEIIIIHSKIYYKWVRNLIRSQTKMGFEL